MITGQLALLGGVFMLGCVGGAIVLFCLLAAVVACMRSSQVNQWEEKRRQQ